MGSELFGPDFVDSLGISDSLERQMAEVLLREGCISHLRTSLLAANEVGVDLRERLESAIVVQDGDNSSLVIDLYSYVTYRQVTGRIDKLREQLADFGLGVRSYERLGWYLDGEREGRSMLVAQTEADILKLLDEGLLAQLPWVAVGEVRRVYIPEIRFYPERHLPKPLVVLVQEGGASDARVAVLASEWQRQRLRVALQEGYLDEIVWQRYYRGDGRVGKLAMSKFVSEVNSLLGFSLFEFLASDWNIGAAVNGNPDARGGVIRRWFDDRGYDIKKHANLIPSLESRILDEKVPVSKGRGRLVAESIHLQWVRLEDAVAQLARDESDMPCKLSGHRPYLLIIEDNLHPQGLQVWLEITEEQARLISSWQKSLDLELPGSVPRRLREGEVGKFTNLVQRLRDQGWEIKGGTGTVKQIPDPPPGNRKKWILRFPIPYYSSSVR